MSEYDHCAQRTYLFSSLFSILQQEYSFSLFVTDERGRERDSSGLVLSCLLLVAYGASFARQTSSSEVAVCVELL